MEHGYAVLIVLVVVILVLHWQYKNQAKQERLFGFFKKACGIAPKFQMVSLINMIGKSLGKTWSDQGGANSFSIVRMDIANQAGDVEGYLLVVEKGSPVTLGWKSVATNTIRIVTASTYLGYDLTVPNANQLVLTKDGAKITLSQTK